MPEPKLYASHAQRQAAYRRRCREATERQLRDKGLPALPAVSTIPGATRWCQAITNATELLSMVAEEMESYFDDRSEAWQESDRADTFRERLDAICEARDMVADLATA